MPHRVYIWTGSRPSNGARDLAQAMGVRRIRTEGSTYRYRYGDTIINWGTGHAFTETYLPDGFEMINNPFAVANAINKLRCFNILKDNDVSIPEYTTDRRLVDRDHNWLARHTITGSGGAGISIINPGDTIPDAPLYVKYIPKKYEVRIHVSQGRAFDVQQKRKRTGVEDPTNGKVRNDANGYVFARNNLSIPDGVLSLCKAQAERAVVGLGLDFGAVDVIYNEHRNTAYVLEVNTSPGLEGSTVTNYANMLRSMIDV